MTLAEKLDREISINVRLKYADFQGYVRCYTCGEIAHWKGMLCGHFRLRANYTTRYDERNLRPQCPTCNMEKGGQEDIFEEELRDELGDEEVDELIALSKEIADVTDEWLVEKIDYYKRKNKKLGV